MSWDAAGAAPFVLAAYYAILGILAFYGIHRVVLLARWWRTRGSAEARPPWRDPAPRVTVQLPLYNERYVAARLLRAVARLD